MSKNKKIKIAKLAVFNIYGNENIYGLFNNMNTMNRDMNTMNRDISKLRHNISESLPIDMSRLESRIEDKISEIYKELKTIKVSVPDKPIEVNVNGDINRLESNINNVDRRLSRLEDQPEVSVDNIGDIAEIEEKLKSYENDIIQLNKKIESLENTVNSQNKKISEQDQLFKDLVSRIEKLENAKEVCDKPSETVVGERAEIKPEPFLIPVLRSNAQTVIVDEDSTEKEIMDYLKKVADISEIEGFLNKDIIEDSHQKIYLKIFAKYKKDLVNEIRKIDIDDLDEDEISETIISIVGSSVKNTITEKVIPPLCDRIKNNYREYAEFLRIINKYLSSIGFYNEEIKVDDLVTNGTNSIHMNVNYTKTNDMKKHGRIYEIDSLPYMINYIDEDGNEAAYVCKGVCSAYRFE